MADVAIDMESEMRRAHVDTRPRTYAWRVTTVYPTMGAEAFAGSLQLMIYLVTMLAVVLSWLSLPR